MSQMALGPGSVCTLPMRLMGARTHRRGSSALRAPGPMSLVCGCGQNTQICSSRAKPQEIGVVSAPGPQPRPDSQQVASFKRLGAPKWEKKPYWVLGSNFSLVWKWLMRAPSTARCQPLWGQTDQT